MINTNRSIGSPVTIDDSNNRIIDCFILSQLMILLIELLIEVLIVSVVVLGAAIFGTQ